MQLICPWCGLRDQKEFVYGGSAQAKRPAQEETDPEAWLAYLYLRDNPKGPHDEYWHHERGCRRWLVVKRNTQTHEILEVRFAAGASR
ncbi:sarcosine oxidase subunit delta [Rhodovibrionaceae bacterium A322]